MKRELFRCRSCDIYTMQEQCPKCDAPTVISSPQRFSPEDRYGRYRRMLKKEREGDADE